MLNLVLVYVLYSQYGLQICFLDEISTRHMPFARVIGMQINFLPSAFYLVLPMQGLSLVCLQLMHWRLVVALFCLYAYKMVSHQQAYRPLTAKVIFTQQDSVIAHVQHKIVSSRMFNITILFGMCQHGFTIRFSNDDFFFFILQVARQVGGQQNFFFFWFSINENPQFLFEAIL